MRSCVIDRWSARFAGIVLLALAVLATGCGRPTDEAWLRFVGFGDTSTTVVEGELRDNKTLTATAKFENASQNVGATGGIGIVVNRVRIDYRMDRYSPPSAEYGVSLYLAPPAANAATTGTLTVSLVSASLKQWLIDAGAGKNRQFVELTAEVTFFGETDDGAKLETAGGIRIVLTNTDEVVTTPVTSLPTVYVVKTADASKIGADGAFTVVRSGSVAASLTVSFSPDVSSTAISGTDYVPIGSSAFILAGQGSSNISVSALSGATVGRTLKIKLNDSLSYTVGIPSTASLTIID